MGLLSREDQDHYLAPWVFKALEKAGVAHRGMQYIGMGSWGPAFADEDTVLKITTDKTEVANAVAVSNHAKRTGVWPSGFAEVVKAGIIELPNKFQLGFLRLELIPGDKYLPMADVDSINTAMKDDAVDQLDDDLKRFVYEVMDLFEDLTGDTADPGEDNTIWSGSQWVQVDYGSGTVFGSNKMDAHHPGDHKIKVNRGWDDDD